MLFTKIHFAALIAGLGAVSPLAVHLWTPVPPPGVSVSSVPAVSVPRRPSTPQPVSLPPASSRRSARPASAPAPSARPSPVSSVAASPTAAPSSTSAPATTPPASPSAPSLAAPWTTVPVSRYNYGLNVFSYDQQLAAPSTITALNALGTGVQQFPNLNTWSWTTNEARPGTPEPVSLAQWGQILQATGSQGLFIFDYDENPTWTGGGTPADAAAVTQYIVQHHLPITAIVIGSEEYGSWDFAANMNPSTSASYYATQAAAIAQAIHAVDPSMRVGVSFDPGQDPYDLNWNQTVLRATAPYINFVSVHDYPLTAPLSNAGLLATLPNAIAGEMHDVQSEIHANVPPSLASRIQVWITEFNPYGQPTVQSTQPVYGAALVESAILWRALGAARLIVWSYDGQAHAPTAGWPVDTTAGTPYGLFALAGDGQTPELPMNQLYPSGVALAQFLHAIGSGGTLTVWAGSSLVIGQVASASGHTAFVINQSAAAQTLTINGHAVTLAPAALTVLSEAGPLHVASALAAPSYTQSRPLLSYVPAPTVTQPPSTVYPGETVALTGEGFGTAPGFVTLGQGSVSYGAPGNAYAVRITQWSATTVSFVVPNGYSGPGLTPGTAATLQIASRSGVPSPSYTVAVAAPPVLPITALQPNPVAPGQWMTLTGDGFGSAQGSGYVWIRQNGVNWGAPGNAYPVAIQRWTNTRITFLAPTNAYAVDGHWEAALQPGSATVTVVSGAGGQSAPTSFAVNAPS